MTDAFGKTQQHPCIFSAGILKGFLGLSASICATIYIGVFKPDQRSFLLFLALFPAVLAVLALPFVNLVPFEEQSESPAVHKGFTPGETEAYCMPYVKPFHTLFPLQAACVFGKKYQNSIWCVAESFSPHGNRCAHGGISWPCAVFLNPMALPFPRVWDSRGSAASVMSTGARSSQNHPQGCGCEKSRNPMGAPGWGPWGSGDPVSLLFRATALWTVVVLVLVLVSIARVALLSESHSPGQGLARS